LFSVQVLMTDVISADAELQMMMPSHPAALSVSADAVTCSEICPWSTYMMSTSNAFAAASRINLHWLPNVSVELQMETPINGFFAAALLFSPCPFANTKEQASSTQSTNNPTFFMMNLLKYH
jgi:hypothetical protein